MHFIERRLFIYTSSVKDGVIEMWAILTSSLDDFWVFLGCWPRCLTVPVYWASQVLQNGPVTYKTVFVVVTEGAYDLDWFLLHVIHPCIFGDVGPGWCKYLMSLWAERLTIIIWEKKKRILEKCLPVIKGFGQGSQNLSLFSLFWSSSWEYKRGIYLLLVSCIPSRSEDKGRELTDVGKQCLLGS